MITIGLVALLLAAAGPVWAGELILANGSRVAGVLANDVLMVTTGSDLVEVSPEHVVLLTPAEIRLRDGRVIKGTVVGGRVRARTPLGELSIKTDELQSYQAEGVTPAPAAPAPVATPVRVSTPAPAAPAPAAAATPAPAPTPPATTSAPAPSHIASGADAGLPSVSMYQTPPPAAEPAPPRTAPVQVAVATQELRPPMGVRLEVIVGESVLRRDAVQGGRPVGKVVRGEQVTYLDVVDRRLRIFNALLFDGGHWVKVRAGDGTIGWLPATTVREVR